MSRTGTVGKRCTGCGRAARRQGEDREPKLRECPRCGGKSFSWFYVVDVSPPGAKRKQKTAGGFATRAEAVAALDERKADATAGRTTEPSKTLLRDFTGQWLQASEGRLAATTLRSYEQLMRCYVLPELGHQQLRALNAGQFQALYQQLARDGRIDGPGGLAAASIQRVHAACRAVLADAVAWGLLPRHPVDGAKPPAQTREAQREVEDVWDSRQLAAFLNGIADHRLHSLFYLIGTTGLRRSEAVALRWAHLDLDAQRLSVVEAATAVGYDVRIDKTKNKRRRTVDLGAQTAAVMRQWRERLRFEARTRGDDEIGERVFVDEHGVPLHPDRVSKVFDRLVARSALPRIVVRQLRHVHATALLAAGVPPKVVQERLGHHSSAFTQDVYGHVLEGMQGEAADLAERLLDGDGDAADGGEREASEQ